MKRPMVKENLKNIMLPGVSVIVPVYNAENTIDKCVESILNQDYPDLELIIVDNASTDNTLQKVLKYQRDFSGSEYINRRQVKILSKTENQGVAHSRNLGARNANSDIFVFVDSDVVVPLDGIYCITRELLEKHDILAVGGTYSDNTKNFNFISDFKNMDLIYRCNPGVDYVKYLAGFFFVIKKATFWQAGGFPDNFLGATVEDMEFGYNVTKGKSLMFIDKSVSVIHLKRYTLIGMLRTDFSRIIGIMKIIKMLKGRHKAGEHLPIPYITMPYIINLFLPGLILLSVILSIKFKTGWLSSVLILAFIINNFGFIRFLAKKRGGIFVLKSLFVLFVEYIVVPAAIFLSLFTAVSNHSSKEKG